MTVAVDKLMATTGATSTPLRRAIAGTVVASALGMLAGLVVGLLAHPPTARLAVFEVGIPVGALGAIIGGVLGLLVAAFRYCANRVCAITVRR